MTAIMPPPDSAATGAQRLDKWLWYARVVKTRSMATALVLDGKVRLNRSRVEKPSQPVRTGDVVTVAAHSRVRVLRVLAAGDRRGAPAIARTLYEDLTAGESAPAREAADTATPRPRPGGRPSKRERRLLDRLTKNVE